MDEVDGRVTIEFTAPVWIPLTTVGCAMNIQVTIGMDIKLWVKLRFLNTHTGEKRYLLYSPVSRQNRSGGRGSVGNQWT